MNNADKQAFSSSYQQGLTKREYAAIMAMHGLLANGLTDKKDVAKESIAHADEILKQLREEQVG